MKNKNDFIVIDKKEYGQTKLKTIFREEAEKRKQSTLNRDDWLYPLVLWAATIQKPEVVSLNTENKIKINRCARDTYWIYYLYDELNNKWIDFSTNKACADTTSKIRNKAIKAFRCEISESITKFRDTQGDAKHDTSLVVDHKVPFNFILSLFLSIENKELVDIKTIELTDSYAYRTALVDRKLAGRWVKFHDDLAELQLVTVEQNRHYIHARDNPIKRALTKFQNYENTSIK